MALTVGCLMAATALAAPKPASKPAPKYNLTPASNSKYLADNARRKGVMVLPDGLQYRVIAKGHGKSIMGPDDLVTVQYKGWLINGTVFDQTKPGASAQFPAGRLIPGWVEALSRMRVGDEWELTIPTALGYGADGAGDTIPPNQTLVFDMKLLAVAPSGL
ncbi:MAG TPA: FKBP-type peptidyl-prolyl cis-trans isomerase [Rhizomicrobium sp.]